MSNPVTRFVDWIRAGYPSGMPERDYLAIVALLQRRLSDEEVKEVCHELQREGIAPADNIDIGVGITKVKDELPLPEEVERVRTRLEAKGWPVEDSPAS